MAPRARVAHARRTVGPVVSTWVWAAAAGAAVGFAVLVRVPRRGGPAGGTFARAAGTGPRAAPGRRWRPSRRRPRAGAEEVAEAHAALAAELAALCSAGLDARSAWAALPPLDPDSPAAGTVRCVEAMLAAGGDVAAGLCRAPDPPGRWLALAWHVSTATGAPLAAVLAELAESGRREVGRARRQRAALAGPQATARVLTAMPAMGLALGALIGVNPVSALLGSAAGRVCLFSGSAAWAVGHTWAGVLVRRATR